MLGRDFLFRRGNRGNYFGLWEEGANRRRESIVGRCARDVASSPAETGPRREEVSSPNAKPPEPNLALRAILAYVLGRGVNEKSGFRGAV